MAQSPWLSRVMAYAHAQLDPLALPAPPDANAAAEHAARLAQTARALQRKRANAGYSRADTMLTGPAGVTSAAPTMRKTLLGL